MPSNRNGQSGKDGQPSGSMHSTATVHVASASQRANAIPIVGQVIARIIGLVDNANAADSHRGTLEGLAAEARNLVEFLSGAISSTVDLPNDFEQSVNELKEAFHVIVQLADGAIEARSRIARIATPEKDEALISEIRTMMKDAISKFGLRTNVDVQTTLGRLERILKEQAGDQAEVMTSAILGCLSCAAASWDPGQTCLTGTRAKLLEEIRRKSKSSKSRSNIVWLRGMAGCGKTTIAHSIANELYYENSLASSFFFKRDVNDRNNPQMLFSTMVRDLAEHDPAMREAIVRCLKDNRSLGRGTFPLQFSELVLKPVKQVSGPYKSGKAFPKFVVWDALDECQDPAEWRRFIETLESGLTALSPVLRFIITSRPISDIVLLMDSINAEQIPLDPFNIDDTDKDLEAYLKHSFDHGLKFRAFRRRGRLLVWPQDEQVTALVCRAAGLFEWAATALRFIESSTFPDERLQVLLSSKVCPEAEVALDQLYTLVLQDVKLTDFSSAFQLVVGAILVLQTPLRVTALSELLQTSYSRAVTVVEELGAVITPPSAKDPVRILHPSFFDFLTSASRCKMAGFLIYQCEQHARLAHCCLETMHRLLKRNICEIDNSYTMNAEIDDLESRWESHVPEELEYACCFFADHVYKASNILDVVPLLKTFYYEDLLHWLEAMSLLERVQQVRKWKKQRQRATTVESLQKNAINVAVEALKKLHKLLQGESSYVPFRAIANDALRFSESFETILQTNAAHVYISALVFTPPNSQLYALYQSQLASQMKLIHGSRLSWPLCRVVIELPDVVTSVAYSKDGCMIASACHDDHSLYLWDAATGASILSRLKGHTDFVTSVAFSDDCTVVISGSYDQTVRFWSTTTGKPIEPSIEGHSSFIRSLAWSPDGKYICSGCADGAIYIWEAATRKPVCHPINTPSGVYSVAFSGTGRYIVSGNENGALRFWDSATGQPCNATIQNGKLVNSVAISRDERYIVCGGGDGAIRLWDTSTGQLRFTMLGHTESVTAVAISCDSRHVVSASYDHTLRLWDSATGQLLLPILEGHNDQVTSVSFCEDGRHIASGSWDNTLRVWDISSFDSNAAISSALCDGNNVHMTSVNSSDAMSQTAGKAADTSTSDEDAALEPFLALLNKHKYFSVPWKAFVKQGWKLLHEVDSTYGEMFGPYNIDEKYWVREDTREQRAVVWLPPDFRPADTTDYACTQTHIIVRNDVGKIAVLQIA